MCGMVGYFEPWHDERSARVTVEAMAATLRHRGPDDAGFHVDDQVAFGFTRLAINDLAGGHQPFYGEDGRVVAMTTGEIYNADELRAELVAKGHRLRTRCDTEVVPHLYEEYGREFVARLDGQFAVVVYDAAAKTLLAARDHFGVTPLFYRVDGDRFLFGSEIKGILEHPEVPRRVDVGGLDQVLTLPGLVSPGTMFEGIHSIPPGTAVEFSPGSALKTWTYWDLDYPLSTADVPELSEAAYADQLEELLLRAVEKRLQSDVGVGLYLSGGLDSSLVGALMRHFLPHQDLPSFGAAFAEREISESEHQRRMSAALDTRHTERFVHGEEIAERLSSVVWHTECPLKESFNSAAHALSESAHDAGVKVVLTGQGADEFFGGYIGYRFDHLRRRQGTTDVDDAEARLRARAWGDETYFYERNYTEFARTKSALYSPSLRARAADFDCLARSPIDPSKIVGRDDLHRRSYLDLKLRLGDHLLGDHGDRMVFAHSVESRHPFLDKDLVQFLTTVPPGLKLKGLEEKHLLKSVARSWIPHSIVDREKFGFTAPGSPSLLRQGDPAFTALVSRDRIEADGYFDPDTVESLVAAYTEPGFRINVPFESDLLMTVITFNMLLDQFRLPALAA